MLLVVFAFVVQFFILYGLLMLAKKRQHYHPVRPCSLCIVVVGAHHNNSRITSIIVHKETPLVVAKGCHHCAILRKIGKDVNTVVSHPCSNYTSTRVSIYCARQQQGKSNNSRPAVSSYYWQ